MGQQFLSGLFLRMSRLRVSLAFKHAKGSCPLMRFYCPWWQAVGRPLRPLACRVHSGGNAQVTCHSGGRAHEQWLLCQANTNKRTGWSHGSIFWAARPKIAPVAWRLSLANAKARRAMPYFPDQSHFRAIALSTGASVIPSGMTGISSTSSATMSESCSPIVQAGRAWICPLSKY